MLALSVATIVVSVTSNSIADWVLVWQNVHVGWDSSMPWLIKGIAQGKSCLKQGLPCGPVITGSFGDWFILPKYYSIAVGMYVAVCEALGAYGSHRVCLCVCLSHVSLQRLKLSTKNCSNCLMTHITFMPQDAYISPCTQPTDTSSTHEQHSYYISEDTMSWCCWGFALDISFADAPFALRWSTGQSFSVLDANCILVIGKPTYTHVT